MCSAVLSLKLLNVCKRLICEQNNCLEMVVKTFCYRQDCRVAANCRYCFKIRFFAPQGRLVAPIQIKLCRTDGHLGPLGFAKFHVNRCRGVGMRPEISKISTFLKESPRRGDSLDRFQKFVGAFIRLSIYVSISNFM